MGMFDFLKKKKQESKPEEELPPYHMPPAAASTEEGALPPLPPLPQAGPEPMPEIPRTAPHPTEPEKSKGEPKPVPPATQPKTMPVIKAEPAPVVPPIKPKAAMPFKKTYKEQAKGPLFVKLEDYRDILGRADEIQSGLKDAEEAIKKMEDIKNDREKEMKKWRSNLEDIQRKLMYVDKVIFE